MLRTNCKQAVENIKRYITDHFDCSGFNDIQEPETFDGVAETIYAIFLREKRSNDDYYRRNRISDYEIFKDWCQGLPSILDTCYYYNRSAVDDLGNILEETEEERNRYSEDQAQEMLTQLIWREVVRGHNRYAY